MNNNMFQNELNSLLADRFSITEAIRANYARGEDIYDPVLPLGIAFPKTTEEVSKTALFLSSDLSSGITGEIIHVDTGYNIMGI